MGVFNHSENKNTNQHTFSSSDGFIRSLSDELIELFVLFNTELINCSPVRLIPLNKLFNLFVFFAIFILID